MSGFTDRIKGKLDEAIGKAKEKHGEMSEQDKTTSPDQPESKDVKSEGEFQNLKGKAEVAKGDFKEKAENVTEEIRDKFKKTG